MGLDADIDADFVRALYEKQNGRCYWLNVPVLPSVETRGPQRPSLDRLDCAKGYTKDNVVLTCAFANIGRRDYGAEDFAKFVNALKQELSNEWTPG